MKVALVTGGGSGIGTAICRKLADEDMLVVCLDRDEAAAQAITQEIGGAAIGFDMAHSNRVEEVLDRIGEPISVLVNNAGICVTQAIGSIAPEGWAKTFQVNVEGAFFLMRAVAERMKESEGGSIVNLASVSGFLPKLEQVDYGASKAAVVSMTRSAALIYGPYGIRVNAVAPGVIDTPLTQSIARQRGEIRQVEPEETLRPVVESTPLRRIGTAEEVASAVWFLASDQSSFITGQTINVCGGFLMR